MATIISNTSVFEELIAKRIERDALDADIEALTAVLITRLGVGGLVDCDAAKGTIVQNSWATVDLDAVRPVAPTFANKVSKRTLDQSKFTLLFKAGAVPAAVLPLVTEKVAKPFVRVTFKQPS